MAGINLTRFVNVNIEKHAASSIIGTREIVTMFTSEGTASTIKTISSLSEANTTYPSTTFPATNAYLNVFFANGGAKVEVHEGKAASAITIDDIKSLGDDHIVITAAATDSTQATAYTAMKNLAISAAAFEGIHQKVIISRAKTTSDNTSIKNFAAKYSTVLGAEMTIAAYLSKINVYNQNSIFDYAFTQEAITAESINDSTFETLMNDNLNVDIYLANSIRNCGGNMKDGSDLTNSYVLIVLHQTVTQALVNLLMTHIKGVSGISKIYTTISQELERYLASGYLTTDKTWTDPDLVKTYNERNYTIIEQGTPISTGYVVKVLPLEALTEADRQAKVAPPVYIVIADQYGIRKITINGEVL